MQPAGEKEPRVTVEDEVKKMETAIHPGKASFGFLIEGSLVHVITMTCNKEHNIKTNVITMDTSEGRQIYKSFDEALTGAEKNEAIMRKKFHLFLQSLSLMSM